MSPKLGQTGAFDGPRVFCPAVIFDDGRWRIWYASRCSDFQAHKYFAIATAVCDGPKS